MGNTSSTEHPRNAAMRAWRSALPSRPSLCPSGPARTSTCGTALPNAERAGARRTRAVARRRRGRGARGSGGTRLVAALRVVDLHRSPDRRSAGARMGPTFACQSVGSACTRKAAGGSRQLRVNATCRSRRRWRPCSNSIGRALGADQPTRFFPRRMGTTGGRCIASSVVCDGEDSARDDT
jgi:hypothetical protein